VSTGGASSITQTSATVSAEVNPNGTEVSRCELEYGPTSAFGYSAPCSPAPGSGSGPQPVSASLTGLSAGAVYHYRVVATNAGGTSEGADQTFVTELPTTPQQQLIPGEAGTSSTQGPSTSPAQGVSASQERGKPAVADAELASTSLMENSSGTLSVRVSCPADAIGCTGTVTLRTLNPVSVGASAHRAEKSKPAIVTLTAGSFYVAGGHVVTVRLRLDQNARTLLTHTHTLRARATIAARDPAGASHTAQVDVTIRAYKASVRRA
jgi:hypothetical protein